MGEEGRVGDGKADIEWMELEWENELPSREGLQQAEIHAPLGNSIIVWTRLEDHTGCHNLICCSSKIGIR